MRQDLSCKAFDPVYADAFVVVAKTEDNEINLFLVEAKTAGIYISTDVLLDAGTYASVTFDQVKVSEANRISTAGQGSNLLNQILNTSHVLFLSRSRSSLIPRSDG